MKKLHAICVLALLSVGVNAAETQMPKLTAVPFTDVKIDDQFWAPRIKLNHEKIVPHALKHCEVRIQNFEKAAGKRAGDFVGIFFDDSDVYKVIEGAAYCLAQRRDPALEKQIDEVIDKIAAAQQPDGYLYTYYTVRKELDKRWSNERTMHETYCAGHLFEAAIAYYQATGKRKFLDVAIRLADHIDSVFGQDKKHDVPGHQEIELALVKLYQITGQQRYFKLSEFFIAERGRFCGRQSQTDYSQDVHPIAEQRKIVGHAVRAMYLYSGVADIAALTGNQDYIKTMDYIWDDVVQRKMYVTGGIGPNPANEGFTVAYDLPNDTAYAETCASIGMAFWNQRMALLHGNAKYADVVERVMYNGALSGVSLDGEKFFYINPLGSIGIHHRQPWFDCACCPGNMARFLPTLSGYAYAHDDKSIFVNQFVESTGKIQLKDSLVTLKQKTEYPWDGDVRITVEPEKEGEFAINLRVPGWCQGSKSAEDLYEYVGRPEANAIEVEINGKKLVNPMIHKGYVSLSRKWKKGDVIEYEMPMPVQRVKANANVKFDQGRVALQRGPIVYCLEGIDNAGQPRCISLPEDAKLKATFRSKLLGGVTVVTGKGLMNIEGSAKPCQFTAVPYYAWDNRTAGQMALWLAEKPDMAERRIALSDGKSFAGWEGDTNKTWRIEQGAFVGGSLKADVPHNEFLCTTRAYTNFVLSLKFKLLGKGANAGVQIRSKRVPNHYEVSGYQADMADPSWWGCLYDESRRDTFLANAEMKYVNQVLKRDDWNEYIIRCDGKRILLYINGQQTIDYTEKDDAIQQHGIIGIQIHGGPPSEAWYKDIVIQEMP